MVSIAADAIRILDALPFDTLLVDGERRVVWANRLVTARSGSAFSGRSCADLVHHACDPPRMCPMKVVFAAGEAASAEFAEEGCGRWVRCSVLPTDLADESGGRLYLNIVRDISERKRAEGALERSRRALRALSQCNQLLLRATSERELLDRVCHLLVEKGGYRLAWVGYAEDDPEKTVRAAAQSGYENDYLSTVRLTWADEERGRGPTGTAIRTGAYAVARDLLRDPAFAPWREDAVKRGYRSSAAFPLEGPGRVLGTLNLYSPEPDAFDQEEIGLLTELAADLSFGIRLFRQREEAKGEEETRADLAGAVDLGLHALCAAVAGRPELAAPIVLRQLEDLELLTHRLAEGSRPGSGGRTPGPDRESP